LFYYEGQQTRVDPVLLGVLCSLKGGWTFRENEPSCNRAGAYADLKVARGDSIAG
jgi:hypothetical protein